MKLNKLLGFIARPFLAVTIVAQEVEEVVITGSYIKSSPTDGASPVEIIGRDEIDNLNATTIADITANIAVNSGSENNSDSFNLSIPIVSLPFSIRDWACLNNECPIFIFAL